MAAQSWGRAVVAALPGRRPLPWLAFTTAQVEGRQAGQRLAIHASRRRRPGYQPAVGAAPAVGGGNGGDAVLARADRLALRAAPVRDSRWPDRGAVVQPSHPP